MRAGPSNMQFPRLLGDSVCCGRIQNAHRTVQHAVSTPFGGFCMLRQNTECAPDRPTCSFHAFWGILYAAAEYRMQGVECKDTGKRRLQQNPRFLRIQNPGLQFLFPHLQPLLTCSTCSSSLSTGWQTEPLVPLLRVSLPAAPASSATGLTNAPARGSARQTPALPPSNIQPCVGADEHGPITTRCRLCARCAC